MEKQTKPRILILMHYMELGGAEMALLGLLKALDPDKVDVDLFIYSHQGPLMKYIPEHINVLGEIKEYSVIEKPVKEIIHISPKIALGRMLAKWNHKKYRNSHPVDGDDGSIYQFMADSIEPYLPRINPDTEYDLCISFLNLHNFGLSKVRACKRLAWIHTDYSALNINQERELQIWGAYDYIASISPDVSRSFIKTFPSLAPKIIEIENILPLQYVKTRADEFSVESEMPKGKGVKLLSIGRFCTAKNYDNVPDIAKKIIENGSPEFKWYIIGFGTDENLIKSKIAEAGMEDHVIILGKKENPYPYIKACDIYVQPSRYEGKSVTVREAQMLGKPVAVTSYPTASSQINDGIDGVIVPLDNEGCAKGLANFIRNKELRVEICHNLELRDFADLKEVNKIYDLIKI